MGDVARKYLEVIFAEGEEAVKMTTSTLILLSHKVK